jgi:spermidine/putrescine transport system substrate-binding protein
MNRPLPEDPMVRSLVKMARKSQLSRRSFLAGAGGGAVALGLSACAADSDLVAAEDISASDPTLNWSNWPFYIDEDDDGNYPTLVRFQEETGISVNYMVDYDDNNTYYAKVRDQLQLGQDIGADIVVPTEWMAARWGQLGFVQELNEANIPNKANVVDSLANPGWDPGRKMSLPLAGWLCRFGLQHRKGRRNPHGGGPVGSRAQGPRSGSLRNARHRRSAHDGQRG